MLFIWDQFKTNLILFCTPLLVVAASGLQLELCMAAEAAADVSKRLLLSLLTCFQHICSSHYSSSSSSFSWSWSQLLTCFLHALPTLTYLQLTLLLLLLLFLLLILLFIPPPPPPPPPPLLDSSWIHKQFCTWCAAFMWCILLFPHQTRDQRSQFTKSCLCWSPVAVRCSIAVFISSRNSFLLFSNEGSYFLLPSNCGS